MELGNNSNIHVTQLDNGTVSVDTQTPFFLSPARWKLSYEAPAAISKWENSSLAMNSTCIGHRILQMPPHDVVASGNNVYAPLSYEQLAHGNDAEQNY